MDGNGYGNRKVRPEWAEQDQERRKGEAGLSGAGSEVWREKNHMLVGDVLEY